ncbi:MAG: hypothetical protein JRG91_04090 [Deltaproteobacteria bacterium]|nr:hypothetical protein [Deltaproteobacteria bacterium]
MLMLAALVWAAAPALADETSVEVEGEGEVEIAEPEAVDEPEGVPDPEGGAAEEPSGDGSPGKTGSLSIQIPGHFHLRFNGLANLQVSGIESWDDPTTPADEILFGSKNMLGQKFWASSRLRIMPELNWNNFLIVKAEFDLITGPWVGDTTQGVGTAHEARDSFYAYDLQGQRFRQLYLELRPSFGLIRIGQQMSQWGMGILANDGSDVLFGYYDGGDIVERVLFATKPFQPTGIEAIKDLAVVFAGDLVFNDITAQMKTCKKGKKIEYCGDLAWQAIAALRWEYRGQQLGFYWVYRNQTTNDDRTLEVMVFDGFAHGQVDFPQDLTAYAEAEVAYITNQLPGLEKTTLAYSISQPDGHWLEQFGMAGKIGLRWKEMIDFWIELGYASGDANNLDGDLLQFKMDPGHRVGMILFPEVLAWQSARASTLASHPNMAGEPVPGVELLTSDGGVFASFYFNPVLRVQPLEYLDGAIGVVVARAATDMVSPFSQKLGGAPLNYLSGPTTSKDLGVELDMAINFSYPVKGVAMGAGAHFGYLWPGRYFTDGNGDRMADVWMVMGRLHMDW